jgi:hypothetical protein
MHHVWQILRHKTGKRIFPWMTVQKDGRTNQFFTRV